MDAALRLLHAALQDRHDLDALLDAPDFFSTNAKTCRQLVKDHSQLSNAFRRAVLSAISAGSTAYTKRNRYIHDVLTENLLDHRWEGASLSRRGDEAPRAVATSFEDAVSLVLELVTATWRLRACALHLLTGEWESMTFGQVSGRWDGSAGSSH